MKLVVRQQPKEYTPPSDTALILPDLIKATTHERFYTTVMTMPGHVKRLKEGRFGARMVVFDNGVKGIMKPQLFSTDAFRGVVRNTQYRREAAAYQLDRQVLDFGIVPPTTLTMYGDIPASIQSYVVGVPAKGIVDKVFDKGQDDWKDILALFTAKVDVDQLRKVVLFDLIANNTDRHAKNCLFDPFTKKVWAIDNGCCFGRYFRHYNDVFHRYIFRKNFKLTDEERTTLEGVTLEKLTTALERYLSKKDIAETYWRVQWVLGHDDLGFAAIAPKGTGKDDFPSYKEWFTVNMKKEPRNRVLAQIAAMDPTTVVAPATS